MLKSSKIVNYGRDFVYRVLYSYEIAEQKKRTRLANPKESDIQELIGKCLSCSIVHDKFHFYSQAPDILFEALKIFENYGIKMRVQISRIPFVGNVLVCDLDKKNITFLHKIRDLHYEKFGKSLKQSLAILEKTAIQKDNQR